MCKKEVFDEQNCWIYRRLDCESQSVVWEKAWLLKIRVCASFLFIVSHFFFFPNLSIKHFKLYFYSIQPFFSYLALHHLAQTDITPILLSRNSRSVDFIPIQTAHGISSHIEQSIVQLRNEFIRKSQKTSTNAQRLHCGASWDLGYAGEKRTIPADQNW